MNDIISNFLSILKNGANLQKSFIDLPQSRRVKKLIIFLIIQGYIAGFTIIKEKKRFRIFLSYSLDHRSVFSGIYRISKPSRRIMLNVVTLKYIHNPYFLFVVSTNQGYLSNTQALLKHIGGELVCVFY
jgi:small subunit ribosomal protein S8